MLVASSVRDVDFEIRSIDGERWVEANLQKGLSFATSMRSFRRVVSLKRRRFEEIDVYAIDDSMPLPPGMRLIRDRPGHASLVVARRMKLSELVAGLEALSSRAECIGRIKVNP